MLSKVVRSIIFVAFGVFVVGCFWKVTDNLHKQEYISKSLQEKLTLTEEYCSQLKNEISTLEQTVDNLKSMEFKFYYPTGMEFDVTSEIKEGENGYYADININGLTANASMAKSFSINGSSYSLNLRDFDLLARTVRAESGGMSEQANIGTANVVFHRIDSTLYPNNMYDVIHQPYQFQVVENGSYLKQPTDKAVSATVQAMNGVDVVPNALGFWSESLVPRNHEVWQYPVIYKIDDHVFSRLDG